jgi:predicted transcriptional regulator
MVQLLIEVDAAMAARLEEVAPARSRLRSEFVREAIRRALWEREEAATRAAYLAQPDTLDGGALDPSAWEPTASTRKTSAPKKSPSPTARKR